MSLTSKFVHFFVEGYLPDIRMAVALVEIIVGTGGIAVVLAFSIFTIAVGNFFDAVIVELLVLAVFALILHAGVVNWKKLHRSGNG